MAITPILLNNTFDEWRLSHNQLIAFANTHEVTIPAVFSQANTAYTRANSAFIQANNAFAAANTVTTVATSAFLAANSAFAAANAEPIAKAAFLAANSAFAAANAEPIAKAAFLGANSAFLAANTADVIAKAAFLQANSAFTAANTADVIAKAAFLGANSAFTAANTATTISTSAFAQANAAYTQANTGGGGGGGGAFNTALSYAFAANVITQLIPHFSPTTSSTRWVLHSIHVTNIDSNVVDHFITAEIAYTGLANVSLAESVMVPAGSAVELLKKPKVMQPNDILKFKGDANSVLEATVTYEIPSGTTHFGGGVDLSTTSATQLLQASSNSVIESIMLVNDTTSNSGSIHVEWVDSSNTHMAYWVYGMAIPANSTVELLDVGKFLANTHRIRVQAVEANKLEVVYSGKTFA